MGLDPVVARSETLLAALWAEPNPAEAEARVRADLRAGALQLTGNFRGREAEVAEAEVAEDD